MSTELDKQTLSLTGRFSSIAGGASRLLILWVPALIVLWASGLAPKAASITDYKDTQNEYLVLKDRALSRAALAEDKVVQEDKSDLEILEERKNVAKNGALLPFKLPGNIEVPIPVVWAPVAWLLIALCGQAYCFVERQHLRSLLARVAAKACETRPEEQALFDELLSEAPFWIAPIARKPGQKATYANCMAILGWRSDISRIIVYVIGCLVFVALEFHVLGMAYSFSDAFGTRQQQWLAPLVACALVIISLALIGATFVPETQSDYKPTDPLPKRDRRTYLLASSTALVLGPIFAVYKRLPLSGSLHNPRYRQRKPQRRSAPTGLSSGFYINSNSNAVHYVLESGQILGAIGVNPKNLKLIDLSDASDPTATFHINPARASASLELHALTLVEEKKIAEACDALLISIEYDRNRINKISKPVDMRTLDLLAGLSVRYSLPEYLEKLVAALDVERSNEVLNGGGSPISERVAKWSNQNLSWHQRWADKSYKVSWCALPTQDTLLEGDERSNRSHTAKYCVEVQPQA